LDILKPVTALFLTYELCMMVLLVYSIDKHNVVQE